MSRGNRKAMIVVDDDDRRMFMEAFGAAAVDCHVRVYACCLMGTHYHALLDTPRGNLSDFVRTLNTSYSKAFNRRHERVGHTFEQRFASLVVQREKYLRRVTRYIALNPVRARLCRDPADWGWSTHRATAGLAGAPPWLHLDWLRWAFRTDRLIDAQNRYQAYVRDPAGLAWSFEDTVALGTRRFHTAIVESLRRGGENRPIPVECQRRAQPALVDVFSAEEPITRSRDAMILIAHEVHGYHLAEIARFLSVSPSTVSKALKRARARC
jgi:REP element-mobilizing transposase RayT